jgi:hypothetical protein
MVCIRCGHELANPEARFCGRCGASQTNARTTANDPPRKSPRNPRNRSLWMGIAACGVLAIIAFFIYVTRPGPCDSIFEQTAPKLDTTLHFLKTDGEVVIGSDKIQDLAESSQRIGILCKTCCIAQQSGKISAGQFQDCLNTTKNYETQILQVASNVNAANSARQKGQVDLVSEKTQQATLAASAAAGELQKLDDSVTAITSGTGVEPTSSSGAGQPPKTVLITKTDGTTIWSYEDSFFLAAMVRTSP